MTRRRLVPLIVLASAAPARAQEAASANGVPYGRTHERCKADSTSLAGYGKCTADEYAIWDTRLNATYATLLHADKYAP